jgi:hypothetical protein
LAAHVGRSRWPLTLAAHVGRSRWPLTLAAHVGRFSHDTNCPPQNIVVACSLLTQNIVFFKFCATVADFGRILSEATRGVSLVQ